MLGDGWISEYGTKTLQSPMKRLNRVHAGSTLIHRSSGPKLAI
jgi:hypothetical protein